MKIHIGVKEKMLATMLAAIITATTAMAIVSHVGFKRGFLGYLNDQSIAGLDAALPRVTAYYRQYRSWDALPTHAPIWFQLVGLPSLQGLSPLVSPPTPGLRFALGNIDVTGAGLRIALLDAQHHFVIGVPQLTADAIDRAIIVDGQTVGYLTLVPIEQLTNVADIRFQRRQLLLTWSIGAAAILIAAFFAVALSNAFLSPLRRIAQAAQRLAAGDFSARLQTASRDEIGQLAADFNQLALALERNEQIRRHLMADVSHELRTPLTVMRAEIEALEEGVRIPSRETFRSLQAEVKLLSTLIDDIYDLSLADVGALNYHKETVELQSLVSDCEAAFRDRFDRAGLHSEMHSQDEPLPVLADSSRIQQLLTNVFENCVRYTNPGGTVRIQCVRNAGGADVIVDDTAPGVATELLPRLFERFFRVESSRNRKTGGAGLGLAICRKIAEAHGGSIHAQASPLGGLRIVISLPLRHT